MREILDLINSRQAFLENIIHNREQNTINVPSGSINVHVVNGKPQYYHYFGSKNQRKYLKGKEIELAKQICQKDYDERVVIAAKKELAILDKLSKFLNNSPCDKIYEHLSPHRRTLITPIYLSDADYVKQWEKEELEPVRFREDSLLFTTDKGERVRSKSEILIANALYKQNIPYRYEQPLRLKSGVTIHPDFTILNVKKRKIIYYEHFGIMDAPQYVENFLKKMETYMENGIFPGDQLIFTFESGKYPINQNTLKLLINQYLK